LDYLWQELIQEITFNHVATVDQRNLAILCKTVADMKKNN